MGKMNTDGEKVNKNCENCKSELTCDTHAMGLTTCRFWQYRKQIYAEIRTTFTMTLPPKERNKVDISTCPELMKAVKKSMDTQSEIFGLDPEVGYFYVIPRHPVTEKSPDYGKFEDVQILLLCKILTCAIKKGAMVE